MAAPGLRPVLRFTLCFTPQRAIGFLQLCSPSDLVSPLLLLLLLLLPPLLPPPLSLLRPVTALVPSDPFAPCRLAPLTGAPWPWPLLPLSFVDPSSPGSLHSLLRQLRSSPARFLLVWRRPGVHLCLPPALLCFPALWFRPVATLLWSLSCAVLLSLSVLPVVSLSFVPKDLH